MQSVSLTTAAANLLRVMVHAKTEVNTSVSLVVDFLTLCHTEFRVCNFFLSTTFMVGKQLLTMLGKYILR
jgi:hypothetical protein